MNETKNKNDKQSSGCGGIVIGAVIGLISSPILAIIYYAIAESTTVGSVDFSGGGSLAIVYYMTIIAPIATIAGAVLGFRLTRKPKIKPNNNHTT